MQKLWLHVIRTYLRIGLFFYFKKIQVVHLEKIPKNGPLLLLSNHQNALLDALLIATKSGRFSYFLTRAAVFKKPMVNKLLRSLRMLPVYRVRDGWNTITNNDSIFNTCSELLKDGHVVTIFPEGSHNLKRTVRPFSKGFTRIVFNTLEKYPNTDLQLIPIGLNFTKAEAFPDSASIYFGDPIKAKAFVSNDRTKDVKNLRVTLEHKISELTTHIPSHNYNEDLKTLEDLNVDFLDPEGVNYCIANNFQSHKVRQKTKTSVIKVFFKSLLIINMLLPYTIWRLWIKPKIDEIEFVSTFRFAVAISMAPIYLLIIVTIIGTLFGYEMALSYMAFVFITTLMTTKL